MELSDPPRGAGELGEPQSAAASLAAGSDHRGRQAAGSSASRRSRAAGHLGSGAGGNTAAEIEAWAVAGGPEADAAVGRGRAGAGQHGNDAMMRRPAFFRSRS